MPGRYIKKAQERESSLRLIFDEKRIADEIREKLTVPGKDLSKLALQRLLIRKINEKYNTLDSVAKRAAEIIIEKDGERLKRAGIYRGY